MRNVLTNPKLSTSARLRFIKCYVWSTLLYGVETWTIRKTSQQLLEAFEMWALRTMLRISLTRYITNEKVLRLADTKRSLFETVKQRKLSFFGRPRLQWGDNILQWAGLNFEQCKRMAQNRKRWRSVTGNVNRHATR